MQKQLRAIFEIALLLLFICYTSVTPTLKGASHSLPEWLHACVCVCVRSTLTLTAKLRRACVTYICIHTHM